MSANFNFENYQDLIYLSFRLFVFLFIFNNFPGFLIDLKAEDRL